MRGRRKSAAASRNELAEHFDYILKFTNDIILLIDSDLKIVEANDRAREQYLYTSDELTGMELENILACEMGPQLHDNLNIVNEKGFGTFETIHMRKDKTTFPIEISSRAVMIGGHKYYQSIGRDITDRKRAESELIAAKEKAEESDRLKTAFLHNVSHEIRTPMNAIIGFSSLLKDSDTSPEEQQQYIEIISQSGAQLLSIINDIVDIANVESGRAKLNINEINLNSVLRSLGEQFRINGKQIPINLETALADEDSNIVTDSTKLIQILSNLIGNAVKFTQDGKIDFGYCRKNGFLDFFVKDTGIGISHEYQQRIFDRFYQVDSAISRQFNGTGLGLSICKGYVELMGGTLSVESEPGSGTNFYFTIPYTKA